MKMRNILSSLLFAYALTGVGLLMLAFFLYVFKLGETAVDVGIILICIFVCFNGRTYDRKILAGKQSFLGNAHRFGIFSFASHCFFCSKTTFGYESCSCRDHFLYVYWGWNFGRNAVVKKAFIIYKIMVYYAKNIIT